MVCKSGPARKTRKKNIICRRDKIHVLMYLDL